ncbi:hypothetical protein [Gallaecimonas sp. GXIMD4217]|uniref:hypothetical protein n=1 Tax=Gallaecimonas sp. GXIMD4217 TaxID=3131927 RepID=UPI00311AFB5D
MTVNPYLLAGGVLSALAALLHLGCIWFGAPWYRFFGAGEKMATLAEQGSLTPTLVTSGIATVLGLWSLYAFAGAGLIGRPPLLRIALVAITGVYLVRGLGGFYLMTQPMEQGQAFWLWSSAICLTFGLVHLAGLSQQWSRI